MAKASRLNARSAVTLREPGMYSDGNGLYLQITTAPARALEVDEAGEDRETGGRSWIFRYQINGKRREMGLGALRDLGLADARAKVSDLRKLLRDRKDPIEVRKEERRQQALAAAHALTFKQCAEAFISSNEPAWRNPKHRQQWRNTLTTYVYPVFGEVSVQDVDTAVVLKVLETIWTAKPETASRVRGRIESVLDYAKARGYRAGENPARWRGHLGNILPRRSKVRAVEHHAALPYEEVGAFMAALRQQAGIAARGLEFTILTVARTGEVIEAQWDEFDLDKKVWTVPAGRMKAGKEHRVPLSAAAVAIVKAMKEIATSKRYVFPGMRKGKPISNMAFLQLLKRMKRTDITAHGFRSSFRDWAAERTAFPRDVVEMALAHTIGDKVEAAYRRGDLFRKRIQLMDAWAGYCAAAAQSATIVALNKIA